MDNREIAHNLAYICYYPTEDDKDRAVQLFVETVVLPWNVKDYDMPIMEKYIFDYLENEAGRG